MRSFRWLDVVEASQVGETRRAAVQATNPLTMSDTRRGEVAIVATELATNLVRHAQHGRLLLQTLDLRSETCVELVAIDSGPGMADLHRCLRDGVSTGDTLGTGLGAVRRLSDEF